MTWPLLTSGVRCSCVLLTQLRCSIWGMSIVERESPEVNYALGMSYARQGRKEEARQYLEKAIQLRPNYADALNNLGVLFIQTRQYSEAEREFEACIQQAPDFDQAYLNLARLHVRLNEKEKARNDLQALLQKQPQHKIAQQMLQMLY